MSDNFNELTPAETELLALLNEECAEVQQIISKILRHGYQSYNPFDDAQTPNRELLQKELGHVFNAVTMLRDSGQVSLVAINGYADKKSRSIQEWLHHQNGE